MSSKGTAATRAELNRLHDELAKKFREYLTKGETVVQAGKEYKVSCSAAMLNAIRGFLKDNNVECGAGEATAAVGTLKKQLADLDAVKYDEDEAPHFTN